jgi:hypothetical protein
MTQIDTQQRRTVSPSNPARPDITARGPVKRGSVWHGVATCIDTVTGHRRRETGGASQYTRSGFELSKTSLRIPLVWIRHRALRSTDVFLGAYPRSGSTWTRFVLYEILTGREAGFKEVNATLRGVGSLDRGVPLLPGAGRLLGTHERYRAEYKRAIYLVRDGRDVLLSEYSYLRALGFFHGDFDSFIAGFLGHKGRVNGFGPWQRHVTSWLNSAVAQTPDFLFIRFEDLRSKPEDWFARIADFLGVNATPHTIKRALANNSLARMREKESAAPQLPPGKDSFVRSGSIQGWRERLSQEQLAFFERYAEESLQRVGYPLAAFSKEIMAGGITR